MNQALADYYRLPPGQLVDFVTTPNINLCKKGFFQFGKGNICFGRSAIGPSVSPEGSSEFDAAASSRPTGTLVELPIDFAEVIENLRLEKYRQTGPFGVLSDGSGDFLHSLYYRLRRFLPFPVRRKLQRIHLSDWNELTFPAWPVDSTVDRLHEEALRLCMEANGISEVPFVWFWPEGAPGCLILTHDVETAVGRDFTSQLLDLDESYGFKAAYQVIPEERYEFSGKYVSEIRDRGCEFNVHDLNHDGHLYSRRGEFRQRATRINNYLRLYQSSGFRAGAMYRRQDWYDAFEFEYDMSVPNVAHLEAMRGGCCTVMPYFVGKILEIPLTTVQDYSLFHILNDYSIDLWKKQIALIRQRKGLMSFLTHPDYLIGQRERKVYETLLDYLRELVAAEKIWSTLPGELNRWWRARNQMKLVQRDGEWQIEGPEKELGRLAYARLKDGQLVYELA